MQKVMYVCMVHDYPTVIFDVQKLALFASNVFITITYNYANAFS